MSYTRQAAMSLLVLSLALSSSCVQGQDYPDGGWEYHFTPYLWLSGVKGNLTVRGIPADVDASFSDLAENLDFAVQGRFEALRDEWGYFLDFTYLDLSADAEVRGSSGSIDFTQWLVEIGGVYRLWKRPRGVGDECHSLDVLFGGRYWSLEGDLSTAQARFGLVDDDWFDPIVGARYTMDLSSRWAFRTRFDIGGFGAGSDFTWNLVALFGYRTSSRGTLLLGYRVLDVDRESGSGTDLFKFDCTLQGPVLGFDYRF